MGETGEKAASRGTGGGPAGGANGRSGRTGVRLLVLFALLLGGAVDLRAADEPARRRPNVVLILADDIAWTDYGFMGHPQIRTPRLDRLASESLTFTRGYVPTSLCRASLMSLATGRYPHEHRVTGNDPPKGTNRREMLKHVARHPTIARRLSAAPPEGAGYLSLQTGKWWEGRYSEGGFTDGMTHGDPSRGGRHGDEGLKIGRQGIGPIKEFLDRTGDRPFFLWYAPMLPHQPHNPPERLLAKYRDQVDSLHVAKYYAMCEWFDETCGELLDEIDRRGLRDDTIVFYLADNGWIQDPAAAKFDLRSKRSPYDGGLRTPLLVRQPGRIAPRRDERTLASSLDVLPTMLAAAGLPVDKSLPGVDLATLDANRPPQRKALFGAIFEHDQPDLDDPAPGLLHRWCVADDWKLIVSRGAAAPELYQIADDPTERRNLAQTHPEQVERLSGLLDAWWKP